MNRRRSTLLSRCLVIIAATTGFAALWADTPAPDELWQRYRDGLLAEPGLVRLYGFDDVSDSSSTVASLVGDEATLSFVPYKARDAEPVDDLVLAPGRWPGTKAVSLDQGCYQGPPFDATDEGFSIECWFREHGPGTLQPRGPNGTLLSASSGYYDGWRITLSEKHHTISFALGRPGPEFAVSAACGNPVPRGEWLHLAATWNRVTMRVYIDGVQRAEASRRWTGSWYTIFLTVDRFGGEAVDDPFEAKLRDHLEAYRLACHDLEVEPPSFVPLEIEMTVCVEPGYYRSDVEEELLGVFGARDLPDGRRGVFHPDNFTFGQPVYLSPLIARAMEVPGVRWVEVDRFQRQGETSRGELDRAVLEVDRLEIVRLDSDPNRPENGVISFAMEGGQ